MVDDRKQNEMEGALLFDDEDEGGDDLGPREGEGGQRVDAHANECARRPPAWEQGRAGPPRRRAQTGRREILQILNQHLSAADAHFLMGLWVGTCAEQPGQPQ